MKSDAVNDYLLKNVVGNLILVSQYKSEVTCLLSASTFFNLNLSIDVSTVVGCSVILSSFNVWECAARFSSCICEQQDKKLEKRN